MGALTPLPADIAIAPQVLLFVAYALSYLSLNALLAAACWTNGRLFAWGHADAFLVASSLNNAFWKFCFAALLCALAGFPPFHSFVLKVALLAHLTHFAPWATLASLVALLFLSWYAYQAFIFRVLAASSASPVVPTRRSALTVLLAPSTTLALVFGFCFLDDLLLFAAWVL